MMKMYQKSAVALLAALFATFAGFAQDTVFRRAIALSEAPTADEGKKMLAALLADLPETQYPKAENAYDLARGLVASQMARENQPGVLDMARTMKTAFIARQLNGTIGKLLIEKGRSAEAETLYKEELQKATDKKDTTTFYTYSVYYAELLYKGKRYPEALTAIQPAENGKYLKDPAQENLLAGILVENKLYDRAFPLLDKLVKSGRSDDKTRGWMKRTWTALGKPAKGFDGYIANATDTLRLASMKKVTEHAVNYPAENFRLRDLKGNTVELSALKGKVVFLDFWATWCGPCVASFPVMQAAADKYKGKVEFLFIDTWEKKPSEEERMKAVTGFIKDNKYRFTVLLDNREPGSKTNYEVVAKYKVKGIPAKFIIDKEGTVRYAFTGFSGSFDASLTEIDLFLESLL
ncbi:redoxin domain-containing protein [Chitinophaga lutea]